MPEPRPAASAPDNAAGVPRGARELITRATGARVWRDHRLVLWLHFLLPPILAALVVADSVARLCDGVLSSPEGYEDESFYSGRLEYPQYTRPEVWHGRQVPPVLLSGHAKKIREWKEEQSLQRTLARRPDLLQQKKEETDE